ncbi:glycosyltransferase [Pseudarthrobacter sp. YAF2]|uniref:glycosyltransferase n=1 Tax=Pseudarthrobacter sp. YAF2 TaxID=3233078 RepID=UPI003F96AFDD
MKVVFALRADAYDKPGGDSKKVARYQEGLREEGWESEVVTSPRELAATKSDIVHLMNLDTPRENLRYSQVAKKTGRPFVISTIRHPFAGMESMYEFGSDRFYSQLRRLGIGAETGIGLREQVKLLKQKNLRAAVVPGTYRSLQWKLVRDAAAIYPMAAGESDAIARDFQSGTPHRIVRNGFSFSSSSTPKTSTPPDYNLVSVGRIEPRKNSLLLAKVAGQTDLKTVFVGALNDNHPGYAQEFLTLVDQHDNLEYLGQQDHGAILSTIQRSEAYINPAWFEVVSQADVEAACAGLRIISTRHSYLEDALGGDVKRFDPLELLGEDAPRRLVELYQSATQVNGAPDRQWRVCSAELAASYREVLGAPL